MRLSVFGLLLGFTFSPFTGLAGTDCTPGDDVLVSLRCIDGVLVDEVLPSTVDGYRQFEIKIDQPVQHSNVNSERFQQRLVLLHRSWNDPMVLQTSGYQIFGVGLSRLARTFGTNQLQVEHRYFAGSTPASRDWTFLNVRESAADFHRVTAAFKQLYRHRWVGTGASKGGMTSSYHRRFYPQDLDGTVADVAPLSFSTDDDRFINFVDAVGGDRYADCRGKLESFQQTVLSRYEIMVGKMDPALAFGHLGSAEVALEHAVIELPFIFWQYGNPEDADTGCNRIPQDGASDDEVFTYFDTINSPGSYSDDSFAVFQAYYFQAGTQLGGPGSKLDHLPNRRHSYSLAQYMPPGVRYRYTNRAMRDVETWVRTQASGMMFIYGEYDPWSAGAYPVGQGPDMHLYTAPGANHGAKFHLLLADDKAAALTTLERWFNRTPVETETEMAAPALDDLEAAVKRQMRLP